MYCPNCKSEYREGYTVCTDCKIDLVDELPDEEMDESERFSEVLHTIQKENLGIIKSLLDSENITYKIFDESFGNLYPVPGTNRLFVVASDYEKAVDLLKDFK